MMIDRWPTIINMLVLSMVLGMSNPVFAQDQDSTAAADSLLQALQKEMAGFDASDDSQGQSSSTSRRASSTNPDISVVTDVRAGYQSEGDRNIDLKLEEVEIALKSVVDPYARGDVFIAMAHEDGEIVFELERRISQHFRCRTACS